MKTLDEVIKANECCDHGEPDSRCEDCPYNGIGACCAERESDALQWLKGYRAHIELDKLRDKCETKNDPLSWDELKQMEGKPVCVELYGSDFDEWVLIHGWNDDIMWFADCNGTLYTEKECRLGQTWQAYRKERE
ncbi:MAG: hypothetical protein IJI07_01175 [Flexilinea sp.]|nr:hypothetical protein [Flexilinea sp.]